MDKTFFFILYYFRYYTLDIFTELLKDRTTFYSYSFDICLASHR